MASHGWVKFIARHTRIIVIFIGLFLLIGGWMWWDKSYSNPQAVWQAMLENNLKANSVTRTITQTDQSGEVEQTIQLFLGEKTFAQGVARLKRSANGGAATVITETLGTTAADYLRYTDLSAPGQTQQLDTSNVLNVWGRQQKPDDSAKTGRFLQEAALGVFPFGKLETHKRRELLDFINQQTPYNVDFTNVQRKSIYDRSALEFDVLINPAKYAAVLQKHAETLGFGQVSGLSASNFEGLPEVRMKVAVDIATRQLLNVTYLNNGRTERFSGYGLKKSLNEPQETITLDELQARLQTIR